jgi:hypothetical protein
LVVVGAHDGTLSQRSNESAQAQVG